MRKTCIVIAEIPVKVQPVLVTCDFLVKRVMCEIYMILILFELSVVNFTMILCLNITCLCIIGCRSCEHHNLDLQAILCNP